MKFYIEQRLFSWFDSYDVCDENQNLIYSVKGELDWGHRLEIYDDKGLHIATLKEAVLTFLPKFEIYMNEEYVGAIVKDFTFFKQSFTLDLNGWYVEGDFFEWDYTIYNGALPVATIAKQLNWTSTYMIDVAQEENQLIALLVVLAIDAAKCSRS